MWVAELWRYPVKSMAGERLERAVATAAGISGDREVVVQDAGGKIITARTRPALLGHRAALAPDGEPTVDGLPWTDPAVASVVIAAAGPGAHLVRSAAPGRFDVLPLLVATDGAIEAFGRGGRRLRPNLVVGGVPGLEERTWEGLALRIGEVVIALRDLRQRCVMTTIDPDTLEQDLSVLRGIVRDFGGTLALNAAVVSGGTIRQGDAVILEAE